MYSRNLGPREIRGLMRWGDLLIPGDDEMPKFSEVAKGKNRSLLDELLGSLHPSDLKALSFILVCFSFLPQFFLKILAFFLSNLEKFPIKLFGPIRLLWIGLRGPIYSLYYGQGHKHILKTIGWETFMEAIEPTSALNENRMPPNNKVDAKDIFRRAKSAQWEIQNTSYSQRINILKNLKHLILDKKEEIVRAIQTDTGKTQYDALVSEIFSSLDHLDYLIKNARKNLRPKKVKTPLAMMGKKSLVRLDPMGTLLVISPWNYPFYQAIAPIALSFMCGNATLYKPSEYTPLKGLLESLLESAGLGEDWVQIVYGDGNIARELIEQRPDKIFFTGSVETGKKIMAQASSMLIPVELELGGKDAMIVFDDINLKRASAGALWGGMTNTGQSCTSVERLYVHKNIYQDFLAEILKLREMLIHQKNFSEHADLGAMTTPEQVKIIAEQIREAKEKGAIFHGLDEWDQKSPFIPPIIVENITSEMKLMREETFGPLIPIIPFEDETEAVEMANNSPFGLGASVWSADLRRAERVAEKLVVGNVSINNVMVTEGNHHMPFGGTKMSGFGRFKGAWGFESFSIIKSVMIDKNSSKIEPNWYPYDETKYNLFSKMMEGLYSGGILNFLKFALNGLKLESYSSKCRRDQKNR